MFASTSTLDLLLPSLEAIQGDVVIHLGTTATSDELELVEDGQIVIGRRLDGDLFEVRVSPL